MNCLKAICKWAEWFWISFSSCSTLASKACMVSKALHDGGFGACSRSFSFPMFYAEVRKHSQGQHDFAAQCDCCRCSNVRQKVVQPVRQRHLSSKRVRKSTCAATLFVAARPSRSLSGSAKWQRLRACSLPLSLQLQTS